MNWDALGAIAELLGAIGVVATLAYLARQIQQNTLAIQGQSDQDFSREFAAWTERQTNNPELQAVFFKAANKQPMTKEENLSFLYLLTEWVVLADGCYRQYERGLMPEETFKGLVLDGLLAYFQIEIFAEWWDSERALLSPAFRTYVNEHRANNTTYKIENDSFEEALERLSSD